MGKDIDINTLEGWNEHIRIANTKELIALGIEPTEENIESYRKEQEEKSKEIIRQFEKNNKLQSVPVKYISETKKFDTEEQAREHNKKLEKEEG